ncbi:MAG: POTRA domain-containing protein, partial [Gammaproteobacteria bacterium]
MISGVEPELERNILAHLSQTSLSCDMSAFQVTRLLPEIRNRITRASRALGYYRSTAEVDVSRANDCWQIGIELEPGDPVLVSAININVSQNEALFRNALTNLNVNVGDKLDQGEYERIKSSLSSLAVENGFFDAEFSNAQLALDLQQNSAAINIDFDPGQRYLIGDVNTQELEALSPDFLSRYITVQSGSFYSSESLLELRNTLNNSQYFSNVTVTPALQRSNNNMVPLDVVLALRPRLVYSYGVGITTDIGPRVRFDFENRYVNRRGHSVEANSAASPVQSSVDFSYRIPWTEPATQRITFSGGLLHEDTDSYDNDIIKLGAGYGFINRFDWQQNVFVNFQHDEYTINRADEKSDLLIGGVNISKTRADDALYPSRGWKLFAQLRGASAEILSTESFLQLQVGAKMIETVGPGRVIAKLDAGYSVVDELVELPVSVQYFTGGDQTVRGYNYQTLGPLNNLGEVTGGRHMLAAGLEYDFNVAPDWKLAVF